MLQTRGTGIPGVLGGRLEFGNPVQIAALKALEVEIALQEERAGKIKDGEIKEFFIDVEFTGSKTVRVWATDKAEAEEIAQENGWTEPDDLEIENVHAREVKGR